MFTSGHVFVCTKRTEQECFSRGLFGAPMTMWSEVSKIHNKTAIFLFKRSKTSPIMYGVFLADGPPCCNIDPDAWGGDYPAQVRVRQYYEFCNLPLTTFKNIFAGTRSGKIGVRITAEQTMYLFTKFIVNTRVFLGHRVMSILSGERDKDSDSDWAKEKLLHLHFPMTCWKELMVSEEIHFLLDSWSISRGGTINDFVLSIQIKGDSSSPRGSTRFFINDWKYFLRIFSEMIRRGLADRMEDLLEILKQKIYPHVAKASEETWAMNPDSAKLDCIALPFSPSERENLEMNVVPNNTTYLSGSGQLYFPLWHYAPELLRAQNVEAGPNDSMVYVCDLIEPYNGRGSVTEVDMMSVSSVDTVPISANSSSTTAQ